MATKYWDSNASSNGAGSQADSYDNRNTAISNTTSNDLVIVKDGVHNIASSHWDFDDVRTERAENKQLAIFTTAADTTRVARISSPLSGDQTVSLQGLVFDAPSSVGGTGTLRAFELSQNSPFTGIMNFLSCKFISGSQAGLFTDIRNGTLNVDNCSFEGVNADGNISGTTSLSNSGDQDISVKNSTFTSTASSNHQHIKVEKVDNLTNVLELSVKDNTFTTDVSGTARYTGINIKAPKATVSGNTFTINSASTTGDSNAIFVSGKLNAPITEGFISNNYVSSKGDSGYLISLGDTALDSHVDAGFVESNHVKGSGTTTSTPHGFLYGAGASNGSFRNNIAEEIYAGFLASKCISGLIKDNLAYNCSGVSYYAKGTTNVTFKGNTAVVNVDCTLAPDKGIAPLAVKEQVDGTNTVNALFENNRLVVTDINYVQALVCVMANQTATFTNNTYIIPDTVDLATAKLFSVDNTSLSGNNPTHTLSEWNALGFVTNDVIIQLPAEEILALALSMKPLDPNAEVTSSASGSGVSVEYANSTNLPTGRDFGTKRYSDNGEIIPNFIHTDFPDV